MKTFLTGLLLILSTSAFAQSISWSQWYALTGKNKLVTTDANGEPSGALGTVSGTNAAFIGGISANNFKVTNFTTIQNATASKVAVFDSLKNLTNAVLTTGTIPVASSTAISDSPVYVTSVTNANVIGGLSADTVDATNGIKSAGTSYIGFGSGAISLTGRLAVTHITNVADLASTTAIAISLSGTNAETIGTHSMSNLDVTNTVKINGITYTFPSTNGLAGQVLQNDGTGFLTWTNVTAAAGGTTNMMVSTISCASATLSPTFAVSGLSTTAASCRRLTMRCTLTNSVTTVSAVAGTLIDGDTMVWELIQDGTGSRTITGWDTSYAFGTDITGITLSTAINTRDFITWTYNSTAGRWYAVGFVRGY